MGAAGGAGGAGKTIFGWGSTFYTATNYRSSPVQIGEASEWLDMNGGGSLLLEVKTDNIKGDPAAADPSAIMIGSGRGTGNVTRRSGKDGVQIPKLDFILSYGQGRSLTAVGHSYIGSNPVDSRERNNEHGDNKVKSDRNIYDLIVHKSDVWHMVEPNSGERIVLVFFI